MVRSAPILVAEDEETDVLLLRIAFKRARLPVDLVVARDGQEAVDYLARPPDQSAPSFPGLLVLDLKMPRMGGFEVLEWLGSQSSFKDLPVVVLSSSAQESDIRKAHDLGARDYLVKPHDVDDLAGILRDLHAKYCSEVSPHDLTA